MCSAAAVLFLAACGRLPEGPAAEMRPSPQPPAATTPAAGFDVLITDLDRDVTVHFGQTIEVYLRAKPGMSSWTNIASDNTAVLASIPTGITAARGVTVAGFLAAAAGTATITAYAGPACAPNQACPMYAVLFSVRVTVTSP